MERPKKQDFEYYQNGLTFKTVNLIEYSKAQDLYIDEIETVKKNETPTLEVNLNSKEAQKDRCDVWNKIYNAPCKAYLFDGKNYIEIKP